MKEAVSSPLVFRLACIIYLFVFGCKTKEQIPSKPNIILLLVDDLGYADLSIHGNTVFETPNLDQLATQSIQFENFYVNPVCAPTRASLLTGRDFIRTGVSHVHGGKDYIHLSETLLPEAMKINGYATGMWGKWHSGITNGYLPWDRGFDEAYVAKLYKHENTQGLLNGKSVEHKGWADSVIVDYAINFIQRNAKEENPYFAFLPFLSPHGPVKAPKEPINKFREKGLSENFASLAGMIHYLDSQVGRLMKYLEEHNQLENTVVIFLSDNGPQFLYGFLDEQEEKLRNQTKHKGHKGNIWEMGVKSPLFISTPWLKPQKNNNLTGVQDLYPTLVDFAGGKFPNSQLPIDGISLIPLLNNDKNTLFEERILVNYASRGWAPTKTIPYTPVGIKDEYAPVDKAQISVDNQIISIYHKEYKLMINAQKRDDQVSVIPNRLLFNYREDLSEKSNLIGKEPEIFNNMNIFAKNWIEEIKKNRNAFQMPVFKIQHDLPENLLRANAPLKKSPLLVNTVFDIRNWGRVGDFAVYHVEADKDATYDVYINVKNFLENQQPQFTISVDDKVNQSLPPKMDQGLLGSIHLPKGYHTLKFEISSLGNESDTDVVNSFSHIILKPAN